ncbi:hypothetical protein P9112_010501 [Eukaryota sp. TZLM1-RC]
MGYTYDMLLSSQLASLRVQASEDTKVRACYTYMFLNKPQTYIAQYFCVSQSFLSRWLQAAFNKSINNDETPNSRLMLSTTEVSFIVYPSSYRGGYFWTKLSAG